MADMPELSEALTQLLFLGLDHGVDSVREGGPLVPFLLASDGQRPSLTRFATDRLEEGVALGRQHAARLPEAIQLAAFAFDGYITVEGKKYDAIIVEAYERTMAESVVLAQRYTPAGKGAALEVVGNAAYLGTTKALLG